MGKNLFHMMSGSCLKCNQSRCGGGGGLFQPILIPPQPKLFKFFGVVGWVVAINKSILKKGKHFHKKK